jgi:DNA polymerase I-like protein with 3'-5' exonuclease and polymerase domains
VIESTWRAPTHLPSLKDADILSLDVETCDPHLEDSGPGGVRGDGHIVGVSLATRDWRGYFPLFHDGGDNCKNPAQVIKWIRRQLSYDMPKTGANLLYDLEWLKTDPRFNLDVAGPKWDVQVAEPLLDETLKTYKLESLAVRHLGSHKEEDLLTRAAVELLGLKAKDDEALNKLIKGNIWRLPGRFVGPYGEGDVDLPIKIIDRQIPLMKADGVWDLFNDVEAPLIDVLLKMRLQGVPADLDRAEMAAKKLSTELLKVRRQLYRRVGRDIDIWSNDDLAAACDKLGIKYLRTAKENPSFKADYLEESENKFLQLVLRARHLDRGGSVFIQSKIIDLAVNGRVHPQFWQVKTDEYGTGSGRFASSNPNMQQVPARDPELGPLIRSLFVPDKGKIWCVQDYKQQEPIVLLHYAYLCGFAGAAEGRQKYIDDPSTDYHQWTAEITDIERKPAKTINLGLSYGMGIKKLAASLGRSVEEARELSRKYHRGLPYVRLMMNRCSDLAANRGYIKTILGRRKHFNLYGPPQWVEGTIPLPYEEAIKKFGRPVKKWFLHKALNSLIQGTSADMIKMAILQNYQLHKFVPYITVHDENDYGVQDKDEARKIRDVMRTCVKLEVPLRVDVEMGPSWGEAVEVEL